MATCTRCGSEGDHDVVDALITVPKQVAYACADCDIIFRG